MKAVWYACQRCGNCCRWPGFVKLTDKDVLEMADSLKLDVEAFTEQYTDLHPDRNKLVLKNKPNGECIFLEGVNTCLVQEAKPEQCRGFPNLWNFPGWREVCEAVEVKA